MPKVELWGDGAGGAKALTTSFVEGSVIEIGGDAELHLFADLSGTDAVAVDVQFQVSFDSGASWDEIPSSIVAIKGSLATKYWRQITPSRCQLRLRLKRRGGDGTTAIYVDVAVRRQDSFLYDSKVINYAIALDDTGGGNPGDPITLTGAMQYGDDIEIGQGDLLELFVIKTGTNNPDEVHIAVEKSIDDGVTDYRIDEIDAVISGETKHAASTIIATDIDATDGLYRTYTVTNITPLSSIKIGSMFSGGTAPNLIIYARIIRK